MGINEKKRRCPFSAKSFNLNFVPSFLIKSKLESKQIQRLMIGLLLESKISALAFCALKLAPK